MPVDPSDGLVVSDAGPWAAEKHRLLGDYIRATWGTRRKFKHRPAYVDVFSGPGRTLVEESGEIADGSPLIAWRAAIANPWPFSEMYVADASPEYCGAVATRLKARGAPAQVKCEKAVEAAKWAGDNLDRNGFHIAFIDPYNLGGLPWAALEMLTWHRHIDFIVHFSVQDLTRNFDRYFAEDQSVLDRFAPGWRDKVGEMRAPDQMRGLFFEHWAALFRGYQLAEKVPSVVNSKNAPLYRMVLLTRHPLGKKIWNSVASVGPQRDLF